MLSIKPIDAHENTNREDCKNNHPALMQNRFCMPFGSVIKNEAYDYKRNEE